jgi:cellulose synthase/poly-beta-1,6-N-acetylglucosamine synthase-like glycosyltransferase
MNTLWVTIYLLTLLGLGIFGLHALVLALLFLKHRRDPLPPPPAPKTWPLVTVQLPIFNEQHVVERLICAVGALSYPSDALSIQVLDDSTDETTELVRRHVAAHRAKGINIELHHRRDRVGYKGGALAAGMRTAPGEFIAVFDADFVPDPDFLQRLVPYLTHDPRLGMVQARWGHLNAAYSTITRAQALSLDGQFVVVQTARSRSGLLVKFNGSAGIWRRVCIDEAGGWAGDTLTEDLDLSFRAQIKGWRLAFVPDVVVAAELTPQMAAVKRQQYRWAHGSVRVLLKLGRALWRSPLGFAQRLEGFVHLTTYLAHVIMLFLVVVCLPVMLIYGVRLPSLPWLVVLGLGPPLLFACSQWSVYPDWKRRLAYLPVLTLLGVGLGLNNSLAVLAALRSGSPSFARTPKFRLETRRDAWRGKPYGLQSDWTVLGELALAVCAAVALTFAIDLAPRLTPLLGAIMLGYGLVGGLGLYQDRIAQRHSGRRHALGPASASARSARRAR